MESARTGPHYSVVTGLFQMWAAIARFHLGHIDQGLAELASANHYSPPIARGIIDSQAFIANAIAGRLHEARAAFGSVAPRLPSAGQRNHQAAWAALEAVLGLSLLGEKSQCGALHPAAEGWIGTGQVLWSPFALAGPRLVAGVAAHAAELPDKAREHFETALRQARELPLRLLQPAAQFWYGRMLLDDPQPAERLRGRGMIEAAATDFRSLEMVTYANLAETLLRKAGNATTRATGQDGRGD